MVLLVPEAVADASALVRQPEQPVKLLHRLGLLMEIFCRQRNILQPSHDIVGRHRDGVEGIQTLK